MQIDEAFSTAREFFSLSKDEKIKYLRRDGTENNGYVCMEQERYASWLQKKKKKKNLRALT